MKHFSILTFLLFFCFAVAQANPGDTTVVQSHTATQLANYGDYDAPAVFPTITTTYRDIRMTFTLGKYQCPGSPQYCGDWDYTAQIYLITPTDSFEIGKLITPYANVSRFAWNWQHRYNFDVTDYAQYFKGNTTIRIHYSGYSGGFTANVKFTFIEGTPPRNVIKIARLWNGSFGYGNIPSIEAKMNARTLQMPANAQTAVLKFNVTGHGSNAADNCSEFCSKYYQVKLNSNLISQTNIWRNDCGRNNLYPQTGTWIYDRANWCPGDVVYSNFHPLNNLTPGSNFNLDVDFQPYAVNNSQASYIAEGQVIYYGAYNYTTDAALEAIIAPNDYEGYFRSNPVCEEAKIKVKNTGNTTINSLELAYGLSNGTLHTMPWSATIQPGESLEIILPGNTELVTIPNTTATFIAKVTKVNGSADANILNNEARSKFTPMPVWPNNLIIRLTTNQAGFNQTKWRLYNSNNLVVKERINTSNLTVYNDTVALPVGCYRLVVDDAGCNGLQWWAAASQGNGSMVVRSVSSPAQIAMKGYFSGDFGCGYTQAFRVQMPLGVKSEKADFNLSVYPSPAQDILNIKINNAVVKNASLELINTIGQQVYAVKAQQPEIQIPVQHLPAGIYLVKCQIDNQYIQKQIVIAH